MDDWLQTPAGQYLLDWEDRQMQAAVADIFGYHALQLGLPELDCLRANRMPHRWQAALKYPFQREGGSPTALACDSTALPFPAASLDLVLMPHTLEHSVDPHATLREVERVLVPEGRVVISGLNLTSLWGFRQKRARLYQKLGFGSLYLPEGGEFIGYWRLRDWLRLLGFEVEVGNFGCYGPAVTRRGWLRRFAWMDKAGPRWWPILGAAYFLVAVKRVRGTRLIGPAWRTLPAVAAKPVSVANQLSPRDMPNDTVARAITTTKEKRV